MHRHPGLIGGRRVFPGGIFLRYDQGEGPPCFVDWGGKEAFPFLRGTFAAAWISGKCGPVRACSRRMLGAVSGLIGEGSP